MRSQRAVCYRDKPGLNRPVTDSKMKWFENNLHHIHRSIDIAAKCKGRPYTFILF